MGEGPHDARLVHRDEDLRGSDAATQDWCRVEGPPVDREPAEQASHLVEVSPSVDQAAERHVTGDPGEAVEPSDPRPEPRGRLAGSVQAAGGVLVHRSARVAAHAAPKPLSIPTTVTPEAQEANIASNAVTPSNEAP